MSRTTERRGRHKGGGTYRWVEGAGCEVQGQAVHTATGKPWNLCPRVYTFFHENCGLPSPFKAMSHIRGVIGSHKADMSWIGRELVQGYEMFERFLKRPRVMDVDDAIWLDWPFGKYAIPHIACQMDAIVAGNSYLADWFSKYCKKVFVLPTAIDISRYTKRPDSIVAQKKKFTIGWTGLASNYMFLKPIEEVLLRFLKDHPDAELQLVAERPWRKTSISAERIRWVRWTEEVEAKALQDMSVGVMPLPDNEWTRGKCSFKMLQYMAAGVPVVVSPVGMNKGVSSKGQVGFAVTSAVISYAVRVAIYETYFRIRVQPFLKNLQLD